MGAVVLAKIGGGAGEGFLEFLGEFAGDEQVAFRAELFFHFVEQFQDAVGGFVENNRGGEVGEFPEPPAPGGGFVVEKAFEEESAAFDGAAEGDGGGEGAGAGDDGDGKAGGADGFGGAGAGVGDAGHARIGDEGEGFAGAEAGEDFVFAGALVEFVAGDHRGADAVAVEQEAGVAGVFGEDMGGGAQDAQGAQGDVFEIADGRADEIEAGRERRRRRRGSLDAPGGAGIGAGPGRETIRFPSPRAGWCAAWRRP